MLQCTKELLIRGISVNYSNIAGFTPLHYAVVQSNNFSFEMVELLVTLGHNIDVNVQIGGRGSEASGWNARGGTGKFTCKVQVAHVFFFKFDVILVKSLS